jgi:hypothetical protein
MKTAKRPSSRKSGKEIRGKKGVDETEKQLIGAGWTQAATQHFIELENDEERLNHIRAMFSINDNDYKYNIRSIYTADFHLGNGIYCLEEQYDAAKTQFVCKALTEMLDTVIAAAGLAEKADFDKLRVQLLDKYQTAFFEFNAEEFKFTPEQTESILRYISYAVVRPIRLIYKTFNSQPYTLPVLEQRKVFQPAVPVPLAEFAEECQLPQIGEEFVPPDIRPPVTVADLKEMMVKYTEGVVSVIEKRYDRLEEGIAKVAGLQ